MNREENESKRSGSKKRLLLFWFGRSLSLLLVYVVISFASGLFAEFLLFTLFEQVNISNIAVCLVLVIYLFLMLSLFISFGSFVARDSGWPAARLTLAVIPLVIISLYLWGLGMYWYEGDAIEPLGNSWFLYTVFHFWSYPLLKALSIYEILSEVVMLLIAVLPSTAIAIGIVMQGRGKKQYTKAQLWRRWGAIPVVMILGILLTVVIPDRALYSSSDYPRVDGATAAIPFAKKLNSEMTGANRIKVTKDTRFSTTHYAYKGLIEGKTDLIFVAGPSDEELTLSKKRGVELEFYPIGRDGFVFLVNEKNPINELTTEQIQDIYGGFATNWAEVGGDDQPIVALQREMNSGSQTYMEKGVMVDAVLTVPSKDHKIGVMGGLIDRINDYRNEESSIGYSFYYYASEMHKRENIKFLMIDGITPSKDTIRSGLYPYTTDLYAVIRSDLSEDHSAREIIDWLDTEPGKRLVEESGFIAVEE
ncbi:substrate-binding domain-containing protein [Paenibacillus sp. Marseille-Q4541]|uniref:substrate-binding domain-containing protein n=1 Tax=Paenibacillus sp. Marseille-Q4541 TaxID=2831522 RepID=UPI001BAAE256|nr:substrate-binding domain-containing protein [Paenibacillus sp. Marseille-Q4541]